MDRSSFTTASGSLRIGLLYFGLLLMLPALQLLGVGPFGPIAGTISSHGVSLLFFAILSAVPVVWVAAVAIKWKTRTAIPRKLFVAGLALALSVPLTAWLRGLAFRLECSRAEFILGALEDFRSQHGIYPENLIALHPDYVPDSVQTSMCAFPNYGYRRATDRTPFQRYELAIIADDQFATFTFYGYLYWPEGQYPRSYEYGRLTPVGKWARFSE